VLSELTRRKRVKEDFNARQAEQQPTVAQEAIASAGMPQEIMPQMAESLAPKSASELSGGVGTSMPMNMRTGGLASFGGEIRGKVGEDIDPFLNEVADMAESRFNIQLDSLPNMPVEPQPAIDFGGRFPQPSFDDFEYDYSITPRPSPIMGGIGSSFGGGKGRARAFGFNQGGLLGDYDEDMDFSNMSMEEMLEFMKRMKGLSSPMKMQEGGTLGIRQNNPGNIRPGAKFFGETGVGSGYATFTNPIYGGRALARLMSTYKKDHGISNVSSFIDRYAPSGDNTPESRKNYKSFLAGKLGIGEDTEIDLDDDNTKLALMKGIVEFENKNQNPYSDQDYNLMIQSAKIDDESEVDKLIGGNVSGSDESGLNLVSQAMASTKTKKDDSMAGEFGASGLKRPDKFLPRMLLGKRSLAPGEIGFEAAYGAGLRPFDESDEVSGSKLPKPLTSYEDLLNLEKASRAEAGFIDSKDIFGGPAVGTNEGEIINKDGKEFVKTKVIEKDDSGKDKIVEKEVELKKDGTVEKTDKKETSTTPSLDDIGARISNLQNQRTSSLEQDIINLQDQLTKDKNVDKYLALARAGLALTDPSKTVSEALTTGLDAFTDANKRYREGVVDLINARSKLAKSKSGLTLNELFNQLAKNRRDTTALMVNKGDPEADKLLAQLKDEEEELRRLIANNPGYSRFGINVQAEKEKLAEQTKS
jgi:hypothetical protein